MKELSFKDSDNMECIVKEIDTSKSYYRNKEPRISVARLNVDIIASRDMKDIFGQGREVALEKPKVVGYTTEIYSQITLTQSKVKELLPILQHFAETGELLSKNISLSDNHHNDKNVLMRHCSLLTKGEFEDCTECYNYPLCKENDRRCDDSNSHMKNDEDLVLWENCDLIMKGEFKYCNDCYRYNICKQAKNKGGNN